ncbi:hypothetical protein MIND_01180800 [Mycena indigotica]|uniref:Membrane-associated proteins in eicosanoid and glutathione metabolism n=1 Tax=Mycena indigotica TaxID=2126181 RepID=A0A8H6S4M3_9AGAR|nr:uncharacterized protein MIND_01180800 [Mycena indigotica]KAF7292819.1 hypothetical protein MIND_01180800 [Mycena indigotica]
MSTIHVPQGFSYVTASLVSTMFLLYGQSSLVSKHRKLSGIQYPRLYAEKAEMEANPAAHLFNCVQRAHQNTLENVTQMYIMTVVLGLTHPKLAASALAAWTASRVLYTMGYATGEPKKRNSALSMPLYGFAFFTLFFGSMYSSYTLVAAGV